MPLFSVNHHHYFHLGDDGIDILNAVAKLISESEKRIMGQAEDLASALTAGVAKLATAIDAAAARVVKDVNTNQSTIATLTAQRDALQAIVDAGGASPAVVQALTDANTALAAAAAKVDEIDPTTSTTLSNS